MKTAIAVENFDSFMHRMRETARKMDRGEKIPPSRRITFEVATDLLAFLTPRRLSILEAVREKPQSVSELARTLQRTRSAVHRDVKALASSGMLRLSRQNNPGHGQVQIVQATAKEFTLTAKV
jgi:predicted transcriptional regulator